MAVHARHLARTLPELPPARPLPPLEVDGGLVGDPALRPVAAKLAQGRRLDGADGLALMTSHDLVGLGHLAHAARRAKNRDLAYYVVNRHVNYTNLCVNGCAFCAFQRQPNQPGAYHLTPEEAAALVADCGTMGLDEIHVVGGCHPNLPFSYYLELLTALGQARPEAAIKAFTPVEVAHLADLNGMDDGEVLDALIAAGLAAMPGGGAEIFSPRVRALVCPRKASGERWLAIAGLAHQRGIPTNATMLYGHVETPAERVRHLLALRDQQDRSQGFNAFIPLAFQPYHTGLDIQRETTGLDDLRVVAASRLILDNFPHIKAYWVMLGPKLAQVALSFGADDLDGTIVEERIGHEAGATSARGLSEPELLNVIRAAGFQPFRRDAFYRPVPVG